MTINHPRVASAKQTSYACPEQYEGKLLDGRWFYFRFRSGWASLEIGDDYNEVMGRTGHGMAVGDSLQGVFESSEQRNDVFTQLLGELVGR